MDGLEGKLREAIMTGEASRTKRSTRNSGCQVVGCIIKCCRGAGRRPRWREFPSTLLLSLSLSLPPAPSLPLFVSLSEVKEHDCSYERRRSGTHTGERSVGGREESCTKLACRSKPTARIVKGNIKAIECGIQALAA